MEQVERHVAPPFEGWRLCGHCEGYGTCHSGRDGASCFVCTTEANVPDPQAAYQGLPCSICEGHGCGAPKEVKINRLVGAGVTIFLCLAVFVILFIAFSYAALFPQVLTFAGTIIGSITGFYFGGRGRAPAGNA